MMIFRQDRVGRFIFSKPIALGMLFGCFLGYLVAVASIVSMRFSPSQPIPTYFAPQPPLQTAVGGWKNVNVFYGEQDHLEIKTPMAQAKQDEYVAAMLGHKKNGFYVDLAANDATYLSNTFTLERDYDWNGLCIEPNPEYWRRLTYRRCEIVAAVVGQVAMEEVEFHIGNDGALGGIAKTGFDNNPSRIRDKSKLQAYYTVTMLHVLEKMKAPEMMDYLSLDVEGAEYYIMKHFPFHRYAFRILTIERPKSELAQLLGRNGYRQLCYIANHGETLWVLSREEKQLDLMSLPSECRESKTMSRESIISSRKATSIRPKTDSQKIGRPSLS